MKPTVSLNAIIGNDSLEVVKRGIESVYDFIDSWCICYNGKSSDTVELIESLLKDKPGKLYSRPWVDDFAYSRNEAIELGRQHGDYLFFLDIDNVASPDIKNLVINPLVDAYIFYIVAENGTMTPRVNLVKSNLPWHYEYTLHEELHCDAKFSFEETNIQIFAKEDGSRSLDPNKRKKDIQTLLKGYKETGDLHYIFYLANTYKNDGQYAQALKFYTLCLNRDRNAECIYYCQLQIARMREELAHPDELVVGDYIKAHTLNPSRAEALGYLALFWENKKLWWAMAWAANEVAGLPMPENTRLFLETPWYNWLALDKLAVGSINSGRIQVGIEACQALLDSDKCPESEKQRIKDNLERALGNKKEFKLN